MARIFRGFFVPLFVTPSDFICILLSKLICWNVQAHPFIHNKSKHSQLLCGKHSSDWLLYCSQPWEWALAMYVQENEHRQPMWLTSWQTVGEEGHSHGVHPDNHTQQFTRSDPLMAHLMMHGRIKDHISGLGHSKETSLYTEHPYWWRRGRHPIQMPASQFLNSFLFFTHLLCQCLNLVFLRGSLFIRASINSYNLC